MRYVLKFVALVCFLTSAFGTRVHALDNVRLGALGLAFWLVSTMVTDRRHTRHDNEELP